MIRIFFLLLSLVVVGDAHADQFMTLKTTKSTQLAGLLDHILPIFKAASNLSVHVAAVEPGQAVAVWQQGGANALLLDDRRAQEQIVAAGYGLDPREVMYDDFVIVGPRSDPAGIRGLAYAGKAFAQIAAKSALFVSPSDETGAHRTELRLWKSAGAQPDKSAAWYHAAKEDMQATLHQAATMNAYTLTDRASWASFADRQHLEILGEGDPALFNVFVGMMVDPEKEARDKYIFAHIWHDWLTDKHGFAAITSYKINGEQIFFSCQGLDAGICRNASAR